MGKQRKGGNVIVLLLIILLVIAIARYYKNHHQGTPLPIDNANDQTGNTNNEPVPAPVAKTDLTTDDKIDTKTDYSVTKSTLTAGRYERDLSLAQKRKYILYIPESVKQNAPLVLFFHGGGGSMDQAENDYNWKREADAKGFVVAFLNGTSKPIFRGKLATWNAGSCCAYARDNNIDDVAFAKATVADIASVVDVDTNRVFASGFSNGGMMSHRLACEAADTFLAIGAVSGGNNTYSCNPSRPISIMHIHALDDESYPYQGGYSTKRDSDQIADYVSIPKTINDWLVRDGLSNVESTRVLSVDGAHCDLYKKSSSNAEVELCVTDHGGHSWPSGAMPKVSGATPTTVIDATDLIWKFFTQQ